MVGCEPPDGRTSGAGSPHQACGTWSKANALRRVTATPLRHDLRNSTAAKGVVTPCSRSRRRAARSHHIYAIRVRQGTRLIRLLGEKRHRVRDSPSDSRSTVFRKLTRIRYYQRRFVRPSRSEPPERIRFLADVSWLHTPANRSYVDRGGRQGSLSAANSTNL